MVLLAALVTTLVLVMRPQDARPAAVPPKIPTVQLAAVYLRGWVDGVVPVGWHAAVVRCRPAGAAYSCFTSATNGRRVACATATIRGYGFQGPLHPAACTAKSAAPSS